MNPGLAGSPYSAISPGTSIRGYGPPHLLEEIRGSPVHLLAAGDAVEHERFEYRLAGGAARIQRVLPVLHVDLEVLSASDAVRYRRAPRDRRRAASAWKANRTGSGAS
jgi:hypothetical protein